MSNPLNLQQRAERAQTLVEELYPSPAIPLRHKDPYTLLISVLLSAQCTDARVNLITPKLFKKADTPQAMIKLSVETIYQIIKPCGLGPRKSESIHKLSGILIDQHEGKVPAEWEALEALPGVGHKTASVVMAQAFGLPAFPVDTHIYRLARRWRLSRGNSVKKVEKDLKRLFASSTWHELHLQMIYYGRQYCTARKCDGKTCPLCLEFNGN